MYVCLCRAVKDRQLRELARQGIACPREAGRRTGAGTVCGTCVNDVERVLRDASASDEPDAAAAK